MRVVFYVAVLDFNINAKVNIQTTPNFIYKGVAIWVERKG